MNTLRAPKSKLPTTMTGFFGHLSDRRPRKSGESANARAKCDTSCLCRREKANPAPLFLQGNSIAHHCHRGRYQARNQHAFNKANENEQQRDIHVRQCEIGDNKTSQRNEENRFTTNATSPYPNRSAKEEHP